MLPDEDATVQSLLMAVARDALKTGSNTTIDPSIVNDLKGLVKVFLKEEKNQKIQNFRCSWLKGKPGK